MTVCIRFVTMHYNDVQNRACSCFVLLDFFSSERIHPETSITFNQRGEKLNEDTAETEKLTTRSQGQQIATAPPIGVLVFSSPKYFICRLLKW